MLNGFRGDFVAADLRRRVRIPAQSAREIRRYAAGARTGKEKGKESEGALFSAEAQPRGGIVFALVIAGLVVYAFFSMLLPQLYDSVAGIVNNAETYSRSIEKWVNNLLNDNPEIQIYVEMGLDEIYNFLRNWVSTSLLSDMQKLLTTLTTSVVAVVRAWRICSSALWRRSTCSGRRMFFRRRPRS